MLLLILWQEPFHEMALVTSYRRQSVVTIGPHGQTSILNCQKPIFLRPSFSFQFGADFFVTRFCMECRQSWGLLSIFYM